MASLLWMADALRAGGCRVREEPGWRTRGHGAMADIRGVLVHHTGAAGMPGARNVVRDGHGSLAGPLAQLTLDPDGTFSVIASGQCWHAGRGGPLLDAPRDRGNSHLIGIEGVSNGTHWTAAQREAYPRGVAALIRHLGARGAAGWVAGHKEWAPGRKVDPGNWDMGAFRRDVDRHLNHQEDDMDDRQNKMLEDVHRELTTRLKSRVGGSQYTDTMFGYAINADANSYRNGQELAGLRVAVARLAEALAAQQGVDPADIKQAVAEAIEENVVRVEIAGREEPDPA